MKMTIDKKVYDTEKDEHLGFKYVGVFGHLNGYEEQLFVNKKGQYYLYGVGGPESVYPEPTIKLLLKEEAELWEQEYHT
jgi:hypothetical protein